MREESYFLGLIAPTSLSIFICFFFVCVWSAMPIGKCKRHSREIWASVGNLIVRLGQTAEGHLLSNRVCLLLLLLLFPDQRSEWKPFKMREEGWTQRGSGSGSTNYITRDKISWSTSWKDRNHLKCVKKVAHRYFTLGTGSDNYITRDKISWSTPWKDKNHIRNGSDNYIPRDKVSWSTPWKDRNHLRCVKKVGRRVSKKGKVVKTFLAHVSLRSATRWAPTI